MDDIPRDEVLAAVEAEVAGLLAAAGRTGPPVDAIALAQGHLGMTVLLDRGQRQRGRAQRAGGSPLVYLRPEHREERHQWTVAHEIGEHLRDRMFARLGIDPRTAHAMSGESLANLFAHRLLTPTPWFHADCRALGHDLPALKERYRTASHEVIALRWLDLPEPCVVAVIDNGRVAKRRANAARVNKKLSPAEEECRRLVADTGKPQCVRRGGWTVQGWPVYEDGWRREVLRSEVEDADN
jgi:Zn-dependent peptidase ImmA (M78 family)